MNVTRLCVVGNSHLAAMKLGWDKLVQLADPVIEDFEIAYFGAPRDMLKKVEVRDGHLVPTTKDVQDQFIALANTSYLDPAHYDVFLLVGLGASFKRVLRLYHACRWPGVAAQPALPLVSPAFARSYLVEGYSGTRLLDIGQKLASITEKPIFALHEPLWSPRHSPSPGGRDYGWLSTADTGDGAALAKLFRQSLADAVAPRLRLLSQPEATIDEHIMTRAEFNMDADKDISGAGGGRDAAHMNADFGAALWRHYLATMRVSQSNTGLAE